LLIRQQVGEFIKRHEKEIIEINMSFFIVMFFGDLVSESVTKKFDHVDKSGALT
jgi:hypothetical protein